MADRRPPSYPPVGDDDRFDRIVARGQSLKRRRQLTRVAGAGGAFAVVALVAAMAVSLGSSPDTEPVAEEPTTTTTSLPDELTIISLDGPPPQFLVIDPEQPVGEVTQQCLGVSVYEGESAAERPELASYEGWACGPGDRGAAPIRLRVAAPKGDPNLGANVGPCAVTISNAVPVTSGTKVGETTFTVTDLPPGSYQLELSAVSGIGDGCGDEQSPYERENIETTSESITVP